MTAVTPTPPSPGAAPGLPAAPARFSTAVDVKTLDVDQNLTEYVHFGRYITVAFFVVVVFLGGIIAWGSLAPLAKGSFATGALSVESNLKTVQHLEGGIVRDILVSAGDTVMAGDALVVLSDTRSKANVGILRGQIAAALAQEARLLAVRDGQDQIIFPDELLELADDPVITEMIAGQTTAFQQQKQTLDGRRQIFEEQIRQSEKEIQGLAAQITSINEQLRLIDQEIAGIQFLVDRGLERQPRLLASQRSAADLRGDREANRAAIAQAEQRIAETELRLIDLVNSVRDEAASGLQQVQERLADLREQRRAAADVLDRTVISAPVDGVVHNLRIHTIGGVVRPGDPILDIVPVNDDLIVAAQVQVTDIDTVSVGTSALVNLSAFSTRDIQQLDGEVIFVSGDAIEDPQTRVRYYEASVRIDKAQLAEQDWVELYPGMPADIIFVSGSRTAVEFVTEPLMDAIRRGFLPD